MSENTNQTSDPPFFIVGNRRSGTTMFRLMLASHPAVGVPPEGGFVLAYEWLFGRKDVRRIRHERLVNVFLAQPNAVDWDLTQDELMAAMARTNPSTLAEAVSSIYEAYLAKRFPASVRWGDKTTGYTDHIPALRRVFPDARFIHLVRDGRDVACSYQKVAHLRASTRNIALTWATTVHTLDAQGREIGPDHFLEVRYEDLVAAPKQELTRVCTFLGLEYADEMLAFWAQNKSEQLEPERHMAWKTLTRTPVSAARVGTWRSDLRPANVAEFETLAGRLLRRHGYELTLGVAQPAILAGDRVRALYSVYWRQRQRFRPSKARLKDWLRRAD